MEIIPIEPPYEDEDPVYAEARIRSFLRSYLEDKVWDLLDACFLVHLIDPKDPSLHLITGSYYIPPRIEKLLTIARADAGIKLKAPLEGKHHRVRPMDFLAWLDGRGITTPPLFRESVLAANGSKSVSRRDKRKMETQQRNQALLDEYQRLIENFPRLTLSDASKRISKMDIGKPLSAETIRRILTDMRSES